MRLARFGHDGDPHYAVTDGDQWHDACELLAGTDSADAEAWSGRLAASTGVLVAALPTLRERLATGCQAGLSSDQVEESLLAPVWGASTIYCASLNYHSHLQETGRPTPSRPHFFLKPGRCVIGPGDAVLLPRVSSKPDYEAELAVVIGSTCKYVSVEAALDYVGGYTILNDVSFRDLQLPADMPGVADWIPGKALDTAAPVGPWITSAEAVPGIRDTSLRLWLGNDLRQDGRTSDMIFGIPQLVSALSQGITLAPGDVIATGTCSGVGARSGRFLADGDEVRIAIGGLGELKHTIRTEDYQVRLERERDNQGWIYDWVVNQSGRAINFAYDAKYLPPEVKSFPMIPRALERQGRHLEKMARAAEAAGHKETAVALYARAIVPYYFGQNVLYVDDNQEKIYLHGKVLECFDGAVRTAAYSIERIEIPFENGTTIQANYHRVPAVDQAPAVVFCPGMDMTKEGYPNPSHNDFVERGMHILSIDGPGQGISNIRKLRLSLDNYERAGQAAIGWLLNRPEVDGERIGVFGVSMGSHWGTQIAGSDSRVKAVATAMACYTNKRLIFDVDAPRFKRIFMYMTGIHDESAFDEFAQAYVLDPYFERISCPMLMVHGEFDPLSNLDEAYALYERVNAPKEFWVLENDFHEPRGIENFGNMDVHQFAADWLRDALNGKLPPDHKRETLVRQKTGVGPYGNQLTDWKLPGRLEEDT